MSDVPATPEATAEVTAKEIMGEAAWPRVITLGSPVQFGKTLITSLTFQRGTLGVLRGMNLGVDRLPNIDQLLEIASKLCAQTPGMLDMMAPDDVQEVLAIALAFFARCRGGGKAL
jgi:hypothetical protein